MKHQTHTPKGQEMGSVVHCNPRMFESSPRRRSARGPLLAFGLAVLCCGVLAAQNDNSQQTAQCTDSEGSVVPCSNTEGIAQAPSGTGSDSQEAAPASDAEGNAQAPPVTDEGAQEPGQGSGAPATSEPCDTVQALAPGGTNQAPVPSGTGRAPEPNESSQAPCVPNEGTQGQNQVQGPGQMQKPAQSRNGQVTNPRETPQKKAVETHPEEPQEKRLRNPYGDLPSLHDLYTQIPSAGGKLQRFGSNAFILGTGNANELPMDLPAGPDYVLGPGDSLIVNMWGAQSNRLSRIIDRQGQIELPEAGAIMITGMTIAQAQSAIQHSLGTQFQNEHVEISLARVRTVRVYVVGDVQRPGAYDVSSLSTPLSALYAAGGPTSRGSLRLLRQYRGQQLVREIDLYDFLLKGVRSDVDRLLPGDTLLVPPVGAQVSVEGMVHRPAIYELNGEKTLNQVLELAGGVLVTASLKQIDVARVVAHERRTMISLQLPNDPAETAQKLAGFQVQDGDDVLISKILPYNQGAVYLEGHVYRPGMYPYKDGMTVNDLLHSFQDVLPEPADHAEVVRLLAPDFRPETISFDLRDALIGNNLFPLEPNDLIRVFGRYEIDAPRVSIEGEVLRPGNYPMSAGMTVAGLVTMAGGFKRSAYQAEADLSSYIVQDGQKVIVNHSSVAVQKALDGDKSADVPLKPGDVVSIRRLAGWQDIGASVAIIGEVEHAGSYGIEDGERLSSVLKRAGGFRSDAYPYAAVLVRVRVRELAEQARLEMIQRIEETPAEIKPGAMNTQVASDLQQSIQMQRTEILTRLRNHPASGRLVIAITSDISRWENTPADIELRAGDTLLIPKRPNFVTVSGQVYNAVAISYTPGKSLGWYFRKAGGATPSGNKKEIYVLRADGSVVPRANNWISNDFMDLRMRPGDTIFVPEKIIGGSLVWQNILGAAQIMSAAALPLAIGGVL